MAIKILRLPSTLDRTGNGRSTHYQHIANGLWPPPVRIGSRSVGWPEHECEAVIAARIGGKSDDEIRSLVTALVAARSKIA